MIHFMALILFTGILVWLGMRCFGILSISSIIDSSPQKTTRECSAQTDRTGPEEERFLELRKGQDEVVIFVMNGTIRIAAIKLKVLQRMNQDILEKCKEILNQKVVDAGMQAEDVSLGAQRTRSRDLSFSVTGVSGF